MTVVTFLMVLSGAFAALSNLCMKKSMDDKGSISTFFLFQLFFTCFVLIGLCPIRAGDYSINLYTIVMATGCGITLALLKFMISFALKKGPSSLTFASVNCASITPALIISVFFSSIVEFPYTTLNLLGSSLVAVGLFWAVWHQTTFLQRWSWIAFAALAFLVHTLFLFLTQWHKIVLEHSHWVPDYLYRGSEKLSSHWFFPLIFATAGLTHLFVYLIIRKSIPKPRESYWGILGGLLNGLCSFFFMQAILDSKGEEQALLFPIFSVSLIIACNVWGQWLYQEKVNWRANALSFIGLIIGA